MAGPRNFNPGPRGNITRNPGFSRGPGMVNRGPRGPRGPKGNWSGGNWKGGGWKGHRHHGHHGRWRGGRFYAYPLYDFDVGYGYYGTSCGWLWQRWIRTGNAIWRIRYEECID
jgi:hypothetical protein